MNRNKWRFFFQTLSIQILFNSSFISNNLQFIQTKYLQLVKEIDQSAIKYEKVISFTITCQLQNNYIFRALRGLATNYIIIYVDLSDFVQGSVSKMSSSFYGPTFIIFLWQLFLFLFFAKISFYQSTYFHDFSLAFNKKSYTLNI